MEKIEQKVKELFGVLQQELSTNTTSVNVFFNAYGYKLEINERTAGQLRMDGISMKNIHGEFIRKS